MIFASEGWNTACVAGFQLHLGMISPGDSIAFTRDEIDGIANDKRYEWGNDVSACLFVT